MPVTLVDVMLIYHFVSAYPQPSGWIDFAWTIYTRHVIWSCCLVTQSRWGESFFVVELQYADSPI